MDYPALYRKRLIPQECILLKDDIILHINEDIMFTKWTTLKPRPDFHHGYSCYFFQEGFKISQFYREDGTLLYWYCDIVTFSFDETQNAITITDLLADVVIHPDGTVNVLDIDELCIAKEQNLISEEEFFLSVKRLGNLLKAIDNHSFKRMTQHFDQYK